MATSPSTAAEAPWPRSEPAALTPGVEQEGIRDAIRGLIGKHSTIDQVRALSESKAGYSREHWTRLVEEMSVTTLAAPEDRGGLGYGMVEIGIILEECGRGLSPEPVYTSAVLGVHALLLAPEPAEDLLTRVFDGSAVATVSTSPRGSERIHAHDTGSGWTLDGDAAAVVCGAEADIVVVSARYAGGVGVFAVEAGTHMNARPRTVLDPTRRQADLAFTRSPARMLASDGDSAAFLDRLRDLATLGLANENTGIIDALLDMTVQYVTTRHQFGRPIGSFQAIKHRLADVLTALERARSAARYAAAVYDENPADARLAIAVAGAVCTDAVVHVAHEAIQLHGGIGFTWEHPAHSYFRRAMGNEALQGDSRSHRARIADLVGI
ncbi:MULTISPECIES: acyl-CoA dehydrogenase family protein [Rhodococcus]|uniref:Acyl-CoA dehydrogenase n=1 Tax=Rhodococcoides kyotonense TaxID=398843 RepID=A0A177YN39_9NOCA|nr:MULTISPECIES: acyl-CoA dehydrogenase family protein [Rhodococcus]NIL77397.1 Acyl-CoA dehydrogenase FadE27 [Rhodococcus sp. B10]OAK56915.1 acyl-CoA dehydrogenase [Rhodococcus kyotonensis]